MLEDTIIINWSISTHSVDHWKLQILHSNGLETDIYNTKSLRSLPLHLKYVNKHVISIILGWVLWKPDAETLRCVWRKFSRERSWDQCLWWSEESRSGPRKRMNCDAFSTESSAGAEGILELVWPLELSRIRERGKARGLASYSHQSAIGYELPLSMGHKLGWGRSSGSGRVSLWVVSSQLSWQPMECVPRAWREDLGGIPHHAPRQLLWNIFS